MMKKRITLIALVLIATLIAGCSANSTMSSESTPGRISSSSSSDYSSPGSAGTSPAAPAASAPAPSASPSAASSSAASSSASSSFSDSGDSLAAPAPSAEAAGAMSSSYDMSIAEAEYPADGLYTEEYDGDYPGQEYLYVRPGLLTAGEWNDNRNYYFILDLIQTNEDWREFEQRWLFNITKRVQVSVFDGDKPVVNAKVDLLDENQSAVFSAQTDNSGIAYLFVSLMSASTNQVAYIRASTTVSETQVFDPYVMQYEFDLPAARQARSLDLMLVIDTTGSMSDELEFLKSELDNVIQQVAKDNANIPVRLSINVYRDIGDDYVVRSMPFEKDIGNQLVFLNAQSAHGGGDFEEAVEIALADAIDGHDWNNDATARIILLVLDAPPHNTPQIRDEMHRLTAAAAEKGIRIIPIASSGIDKNTEFLLRCLSMGTGGSYVFLTDDSGIGYSHIEPTIGEYQVELLNELLVRLLNEYLQ